MAARRVAPLALLLSALGVGGHALVPEEVAGALLRAGLAQVVQSTYSAGVGTGVAEVPSNGTPVVMMHGMGDFAENSMGMVPLRDLIAKTAGAYVHSVAICSIPEQLSGCNSEDQNNGFFMPMDQQVDQFARVVRADPQLAGGFNAVGFSQGNTIIRGYIHRYNDPPVKSFLSLHGVMMGVAGLPHCPTTVIGLGLICKAVDALTSMGAYTSFVQDHLAQANYFRNPRDLETYRKVAHFLPYINNEVPGAENATFKANFASLERLVLVLAEGDTMVHPKESEQFGYFKDGSNSEMVPMKDAPWYTEDWFGLKSLDEAGKVTLASTPGDHLRFSDDFLVALVQRYFVGQATVVV